MKPEALLRKHAKYLREEAERITQDLAAHRAELAKLEEAQVEFLADAEACEAAAEGLGK